MTLLGIVKCDCTMKLYNYDFTMRLMIMIVL